MQSTGHSSRHDLSFTSTHGSAITYVTRAPPNDQAGPPKWAGGNSNPASLLMPDYGYDMGSSQGSDFRGNYRDELKAALGKRVTLRLREPAGGFRDVVGVLQSETSAINKRGEVENFSHDDIAAMRVIPVFNRRNINTGRLALYDTLTRTVDEIPNRDGVVSIYCCGPTVYRSAHVGNLRTFLLSDLITRTLELSDLQVHLIQNITDVGHMSDDFESEDKMLSESEKRKIDPFLIAREFEAEFHRDLALLNIAGADLYPRASENMDSMIQAIQELIAREHAYVGTDGSVYFDARSVSDYGTLSGNKIEQLKPGHRYEFVDLGGKRFHADWALWKLAGGRTQMVWDSPWGKGFPGWHIECSAMSVNFLNAHVDLHLGGIDLRFPHHENERAQSNALTGSNVVSNWVHGEHLLFEGRKMSKSAENVVLVSDVIARGFDPLAVRLVFLENRYRSQMDLTWQSIEAAHSTLKRWRKEVSAWGRSDELKFDEEFTTALMSDLDTPRAMQRIRNIEKDPTIGALDKRALFLYADQVLGLDLTREVVEKELSAEISELLAQREIARAAKDWASSDSLRNEIEKFGIDISDGPTGQQWSWK